VIRLDLESTEQRIVFKIENTKPQNNFFQIQIIQNWFENVRKQLDLLYPKKA
jgi:hypothetical protein